MAKEWDEFKIARLYSRYPKRILALYDCFAMRFNSGYHGFMTHRTFQRKPIFMRAIP